MIEGLLYTFDLIAIAYLVLWGIKQDSKGDEEGE
jgi:hypothetical protein